MVRGRLAARAGVPSEQLDSLRVARFSAAERVEGAKVDEPPLALYRSLPKRPEQVTAPSSWRACAPRATTWRARSADGAFVYGYDSVKDAPTKDPYSLLRHIGSVYAIMEGYQGSTSPTGRRPPSAPSAT